MSAGLEFALKGDRLDGWKAIADYLGRSSRTVQRWHSHFGLPVYRMLGETGGVYAFSRELEDWVTTQRESPGATAAPALALQVSDRPQSAPRSHVPEEPLQNSPVRVPEKNSAWTLTDKAYSIWGVLSFRNVTTMTRLFREAADMDPFNGSALAGLSQSLMVQGMLGQLRLTESHASARAAVEFALEIDPDLPEAKCAEAWLKVLKERDWQGASRAFELLGTSHPTIRTRVGRALLHVAEGSASEASQSLGRLAEEHPLSQTWLGLRCWTDYLAQDYGRARDHIAQARHSGKAGRVLYSAEGLISLQWEPPGAAVEHLHALMEEDPKNKLLESALGYALAASGKTDEARQILNRLTERDSATGRIPHYCRAIVLIGLNERQMAIESVERSYELGPLWSLAFHLDPILEPLRDEPSFQAFVNRSYPQTNG